VTLYTPHQILSVLETSYALAVQLQIGGSIQDADRLIAGTPDGCADGYRLR